MTVRIATARMEDVAGVLALERAAAEAPHWTETAYREMVESPGGSVPRCLVAAWSEGELVGFAAAKVVGDTAELESVAVRVAARRGGVGRALCAAVVAWAWEQGATAVELEVRASSAGAIALYSGLGFAAVGRRRRYYAEPVDDAVLMQLERERRPL